MKRFLLVLALVCLLSPVLSAAQAKKVDIFVTSWCPYCAKLQDFLERNRIEYSRHDVEKDPAAERAFQRMNGQGVPLARVGDQVIHGYDPDKILNALQETQS